MRSLGACIRTPEFSENEKVKRFSDERIPVVQLFL